MSVWHVVVVQGTGRDLRAFVAGFVAERRLDPASVVLGDDVGLEHASLGERLRALLAGGHHAALTPQEVAAPFEEALARSGGAVGLRIVDRHPVTAATFRFEASAFSREVSTSIRTALKGLPDGVRFAEHSEQETEHTDAKGVELYAPVHHYEYRVRGTLAGPPSGVLEVRRRLAAIEAVELDPLHLEPKA